MPRQLRFYRNSFSLSAEPQSKSTLCSCYWWPHTFAPLAGTFIHTPQLDVYIPIEWRPAVSARFESGKVARREYSKIYIGYENEIILANVFFHASSAFLRVFYVADNNRNKLNLTSPIHSSVMADGDPLCPRHIHPSNLIVSFAPPPRSHSPQKCMTRPIRAENSSAISEREKQILISHLRRRLFRIRNHHLAHIHMDANYHRLLPGWNSNN